MPLLAGCIIYRSFDLTVVMIRARCYGTGPALSGPVRLTTDWVSPPGHVFTLYCDWSVMCGAIGSPCTGRAPGPCRPRIGRWIHGETMCGLEWWRRSVLFRPAVPIHLSEQPAFEHHSCERKYKIGYKDPKFCAAWPQKIRPHIGRAWGTGLAYRPSAVRTPLLELPTQKLLHRWTGVTFLSAHGQLLSPFSIHPAGRRSGSPTREYRIG